MAREVHARRKSERDGRVDKHQVEDLQLSNCNKNTDAPGKRLVWSVDGSKKV